MGRALQWRPDAIVSQGTSCDIGPSYLGTSAAFTSEEAEEADLDLIISAARSENVPFIVSLGGAGNDVQLERSLGLVRNVARKRGLHFSVGVLHGEVEKSYVQAAIRKGCQLQSLAGSPRLPGLLMESDVEQAVCIVGQAGPEAIQKALHLGVDGVVAGRTLDAGLIAAIPLANGHDYGNTYGFGALLNDAGAAITPFKVDGLFGVLSDSSFVLTPADPGERCTATSILAGTLRERESPYEEAQPGGILDYRAIQVEELEDNHSVRVAGFRWRKTPYTVKLEGVRLTGYRAVVIAGLRDPENIRRYPMLLQAVRDKLNHYFPDATGVHLDFISYGVNGVLGARETHQVADYEIGLVLDIVAPTQNMATSVARLARSTLLHTGYEGRKSTEGNVAFPFAPTELPIGPVYEWNVWHALPLDNPVEPFRITVERL